MIFVYQMGKVGSSAVVASLRYAGVKENIYYAHWLHHGFPEAEFAVINPKLAKRVKEGKGLDVITMVREPVARNLSAFYATSKDPTKENFINNYNIYYPDEWIKNELYTLGIDIYSYPFNYNKGYKIYKGARHRILAIRLEDANRVFEESIRKFLGIQGCSFLTKNKQQDKKYKRLKKESFSEKFLRRNYNLEYAQYFYTEKEISKYMEKWING